ncbi:hypothetical protein JMJ55_23085 [Belnapia sp. T6]|uniref:Uncharacterized protein n=1 Tax=Belnapia mucosa TaxID=2804532 RepID=A0ABS1VAQ9_9PROT|nr:hypothetical protein [Belnapia mucosa]MBL6458226.1 hypothetical protein [Belnapia mucosa]
MKHIAFASVIAVTLAAGAAQAQAPVDGTGHTATGGSLVGGGGATIEGGGDNMTISYSTYGAGSGGGMPSQPPLFARFAGSLGDGPAVEYLTMAPANPSREAWLVGGGDNAALVYAQPR